MNLIALIQPQHMPIPENITVVQEFGYEQILVSDNIRDTISGTSMFLAGTTEAFIAWLKPHGGIWCTDNPLMGIWVFKEINDE